MVSTMAATDYTILLRGNSKIATSNVLETQALWSPEGRQFINKAFFLHGAV